MKVTVQRGKVSTSSEAEKEKAPQNESLVLVARGGKTKNHPAAPIRQKGHLLEGKNKKWVMFFVQTGTIAKSLVTRSLEGESSKAGISRKICRGSRTTKRCDPKSLRECRQGGQTGSGLPPPPKGKRILSRG